MKRFLIACLIVSAAGFYSFRTITSKYNDILTALGISASSAKDQVYYSFIGGYFSSPGNSTYKTYPAGKRAEGVRQLGSFVKNYLVSAEFQKRYMENYERSKPRAPKSMEARLTEKLDDLKRNLKKWEEGLKKSDAEMKSSYEESIRYAKKWIKIYEDPTDPQHETQVGFIKMGYESDLEYYQKRLDELDKRYPKDISLFIKGRLEEFLRESANVDFNAELFQKGRLKKFVDPAYESKSPTWKYCFRAGREATEAARTFAQQWLAELNTK
jgi:hypothetical protein